MGYRVLVLVKTSTLTYENDLESVGKVISLAQLVCFVCRAILCQHCFCGTKESTGRESFSRSSKETNSLLEVFLFQTLNNPLPNTARKTQHSGYRNKCHEKCWLPIWLKLLKTKCYMNWDQILFLTLFSLNSQMMNWYCFRHLKREG